jgi:hypothetical protein
MSGLASKLRRIQRRFRDRAALSRLRRDCPRRIEILADPDPANPIARLCDQHGSDKGSLHAGPHPYPWAPHSYADIYDLLFRPLRRRVRAVLECGIGSNDPAVPSSMGASGCPGASLRVWRDFFPEAQIYGIDIDEKTLFTEERIVTHRVDQTSRESIAAFLAALPADLRFDLIIDDGLHEVHAGTTLFAALSPRLAEDGLYVIEDVRPAQAETYRAFFRREAPDFTIRLLFLHREGVGLNDNGLIIATRQAGRV